MSTQPRNKILIILIGILLATNVIMLSLFLLSKPERKAERKSPMTNYLKTEIGFTDEQMVRFDTVKSQHRKTVKLVFDNMKTRKDSSFKALGQHAFSDSSMVNAASYSAIQQQELEMMMLKHLKDIRSICTPAQQQKFDTGFYKVMARGKGDDKGKN